MSQGIRTILSIRVTIKPTVWASEMAQQVSDCPQDHMVKGENQILEVFLRPPQT